MKLIRNTYLSSHIKLSYNIIRALYNYACYSSYSILLSFLFQSLICKIKCIQRMYNYNFSITFIVFSLPIFSFSHKIDYTPLKGAKENLSWIKIWDSSVWEAPITTSLKQGHIYVSLPTTTILQNINITLRNNVVHILNPHTDILDIIMVQVNIRI